MEDPTTEKKVADEVQKVMESESMKQVTLEFGKARILFSKGRQLGDALPPLVEPIEYPDVPTNLKDDKDSWLK